MSEDNVMPIESVIAVLEAKVELLASIVTEKENEINSLKTELAEAQAPAPAKAATGAAVTVKLGKTNVRINHAIISAGQKYAIADIAKNKELITELLEAKSTAVSVID